MSPNNRFHQESGQVLLTTALCMFCLIGFLALATDVGLLFRNKVNLQKVADAAAIAGATELTSGNYVAAAKASAARNGVTDGVNGTVTVTFGTPYHPNAVGVRVSQQQSNILLSLFGSGTTMVAASAAAGITNGNGNGCMYAMDTSPFGNVGMTMNGTGDLEIPHCAIYDNSGLKMDGTSGVINAKSIGVAGTYNGGGNPSPDPVTGMVPVSDPMNYWNTPPSYGSCGKDPNLSSGTVSPGCYKGLTLNGAVNMNPGLYVIDGALNLNGVTATGVTFYVDGSSKGTLGSINNSNLTAPTTGTPGTCTAGGGCNGMLMWDTEKTGKAQQGVSFGPGNSTVTGILYFPNASLKYHGDNTTHMYADIIAQSYVFDGTINIENYVLGPNQGSLFLTPTLVE